MVLQRSVLFYFANDGRRSKEKSKDKFIKIEDRKKERSASVNVVLEKWLKKKKDRKEEWAFFFQEKQKNAQGTRGEKERRKAEKDEEKREKEMEEIEIEEKEL